MLEFGDTAVCGHAGGNRPKGFLMAAVSAVFTWVPNPGRAAAFLGQVAKAKAIHTRMGAEVSAAQTLSGGTAASLVYILTFASGAAYGAFTDAANTDAEWQAFWLEINADPTASLVGSATYAAVDL